MKARICHIAVNDQHIWQLSCEPIPLDSPLSKRFKPLLTRPGLLVSMPVALEAFPDLSPSRTWI